MLARTIGADLHDFEMGEPVGKKRRSPKPKWQYAGLAVVAVVAAGSTGLAIAGQPQSVPVPASVASYTPPVETQAPPKRVAVVGDSYSQGTGASSKTIGWVAQLSRHQNWDITNLARGGTGYTTSVNTPATAKKACGLDACPKYADVIPSVASASPEIVIVAGGRNDANVDPEVEAESIRSFYTQLRAAVPNAKIIAFNALWDSTPAPASIGQISTLANESVTAVGGIYLDAGQPLAGHPEFIAPDGVHPKDAGHTAILQANVAKLQEVGLAAR